MKIVVYFIIYLFYIPLVIAQNKIILCKGDSVQLSAQFPMTVTNIHWFPDYYMIGSNTPNPIVFPIHHSFTYIATALDSNGQIVTDSVYVELVNKSIASFSLSNYYVLKNEQIEIIQDYSVYYDRSIWIIDSDTFNVKPTEIIFNTIGDHNITLITDPEKCSDTLTQLVTCLEENYFLFIPSAFTPNSDGLNDAFYFYPIGFKNYEFNVFSRDYGLIYMQNEDTRWNKFWDGYPDKIGKKVHESVYFYHFVGETYAGEKVERKGSFVKIN